MAMKLLLLVVAMATVYVVNCDNTKNVKFTYQGMQCKWSEQHPNNCGKHERSLVITCTKNKKNPNPPKCSYRGDPHPCAWYNKNQKGFYQCLVNVMIGKDNLCTTSSVQCNNHCQEITFNKHNNNVNNDPWQQVEPAESKSFDSESDESPEEYPEEMYEEENEGDDEMRFIPYV